MIAKKITEKYFLYLLSMFVVFLYGPDPKLTEDNLKNPIDSNETWKMIFWYITSTINNHDVSICNCVLGKIVLIFQIWKEVSFLEL